MQIRANSSNMEHNIANYFEVLHPNIHFGLKHSIILWTSLKLSFIIIVSLAPIHTVASQNLVPDVYMGLEYRKHAYVGCISGQDWVQMQNITDSQHEYNANLFSSMSKFDQLNGSMACEQLEKIHIISVDDLSRGMRLPENSLYRQSPHDVCSSKWSSAPIKLNNNQDFYPLSIEAVNFTNINQYNATSHRAHYVASCENLIKEQENFFYRLQKSCHGREKCNFDLKSHLQVTQSDIKCDTLQNLGIKFFLHISYTCLPTRFIMNSKAITDRDMHNSIECRNNRKIYVESTSLTLVKEDSRKSAFSYTECPVGGCKNSLSSLLTYEKTATDYNDNDFEELTTWSNSDRYDDQDRTSNNLSNSTGELDQESVECKNLREGPIILAKHCDSSTNCSLDWVDIKKILSANDTCAIKLFETFRVLAHIEYFCIKQIKSPDKSGLNLLVSEIHGQKKQWLRFVAVRNHTRRDPVLINDQGRLWPYEVSPSITTPGISPTLHPQQPTLSRASGATGSVYIGDKYLTVTTILVLILNKLISNLLAIQHS